jgi:hypothetical protein
MNCSRLPSTHGRSLKASGRKAAGVLSVGGFVLFVVSLFAGDVGLTPGAGSADRWQIAGVIAGACLAAGGALSLGHLERGATRLVVAAVTTSALVLIGARSLPAEDLTCGLPSSVEVAYEIVDGTRTRCVVEIAPERWLVCTTNPGHTDQALCDLSFRKPVP